MLHRDHEASFGFQGYGLVHIANSKLDAIADELVLKLSEN